MTAGAGQTWGTGRALLVVAASLLAGLAGCAGTPGPGGAPAGTSFADASWSERALAFGEGHDHTNLSQHTGLTTPNFEVVGWDPLISESFGRTVGGHHCGDAQPTQDGRRLAAVEMRNQGGFALADVTDPGAPRWLGELVMPRSRMYDLAIVPDGRHLALVTTEEMSSPAPPLPGLDADRLYWRPACAQEWAPVSADLGEDPVPRPMSLILVDIQDPHAPRIVDQRPLGGNGHSVFSAVLDGRTWILVSVLGFQEVDQYQFYEILDTAAGGVLNLLSTHALRGASVHDRVVVHDGWIARHPLSHKTLAFLAGGGIFEILDLGDPRNPASLGTWTDGVGPATPYQGNLHSAYPLPDAWDGHHYTVLGPEFGTRPGEHPSGTVWILDTTDPGHIREVAAWTLPHQVEWDGLYMFSNHYLTVHDRTLFVSMYHGGVWAVDLSGIRADGFTLLPSVGVLMPDRASPHPPTKASRWTPTLQEILSLDDGSLVTFDSYSGLYTVRFDASRPMPAPPPWPLEPATFGS